MVRKHGRPGGSALRRPIAVIACLAAAAALLVPSPAAAASPTRIRHYAGVTSEGDAFAITTVVRAGVVRLREVSIDGTAACEDGTSFEFGHGLGFARGPLISDGQLQYEDIAFSDAFFLLGRLGSKGGSGTVTHLFAALDALEEPQVCTTGELTWQVQRVPESNAVVSDVIVTKVVDGVTSTIRFGSTTTPAAQEAEGRIRSYEGGRRLPTRSSSSRSSIWKRSRCSSWDSAGSSRATTGRRSVWGSSSCSRRSRSSRSGSTTTSPRGSWPCISTAVSVRTGDPARRRRRSPRLRRIWTRKGAGREISRGASGERIPAR